MQQSTTGSMPISQKKVMNRSFVVVGALLIQLCLGALYAWSVFTPYLKKDPFNFSNTQTQIIFSTELLTFAIVMVLSGRWMAKVGPRKVALTGGIVLGIGYILAGLMVSSYMAQIVVCGIIAGLIIPVVRASIPAGTQRDIMRGIMAGGIIALIFGLERHIGTSFSGMVLFIGIVGGVGIGLAYVCPIAVGMKWFPDKKGLITGLAVAGFGFGALIWIKLAGSWGGLLESLGVLQVFLIYGIVFAVLIIIGSIWTVNPPEGWKPAGWTPPITDNGSASDEGLVDFLPKGMLKTPHFYGLWIMFIFSSMAGLMVIGIIKLFGIDILQKNGLTSAQASAIAGTAMAVFYSIANGLGRIIWGSISEKIGCKASLTLMCMLQGIMMLLFYWMGSNQYLLYLGVAIIGFNFGGNFSLFPTVTADFFGTKNVGQNYGWVFTAYGVGGIIGPIMAGKISATGSWLPAFIVGGIACLVAAVIGLALKRPKHTNFFSKYFAFLNEQ